MLSRLIANWVYGGTIAGVMLLILLPAFSQDWTLLEILTFLHLPAYMFHQFEEHDEDRFRLFVNQELGNGLDVLSPLAVFIINIPGVWGLLTITLLLTKLVNPGFALIAVWVVLINSVAHLAQGIAMRRYNPGLITSVLLFFPLSVGTLWIIVSSGAGGMMFQAIGLGTSLAIHAVIIVHVVREKRRLSAVRH